jgi:hypothetical protein
MKRAAQAIGIILLAILTSFLIWIIAWTVTPLGPGVEAQAALVSDSTVSFEQAPHWITFRPKNGPPDTGLILYPGGHVEYRSYAPLARAIAASGYQVTIVRMPLSLAVFGVNRADEVMAAYPDVRSWAIGGHSLGGVMAARYASRHPGKVQGIAFWAAFPADDLSHSQLKGLLTYGSRDGLLDVEMVQASRSLLPPGSVLEIIEGGNHGGFGYYAAQMGDSDAQISPEQQQAQAMELTLQLLREIQGE